jgi:Cu(I)/Ag(I) efflux system membrane fusion protein
VDRGEGHLEPRKVELGEKVDGWYIVLKGLRAGERVVTSGNFLVDSESQLKAATTAMGKAQESMPGMKMDPTPSTPPPAGGHPHD